VTFTQAGAVARRLRADVVVACALWAFAYAAGVWYIGVFNATGAPVDNAQHEFGAAVAMACGRGFVDPGYDATPGLNRFLTNQADRFSCDELPRNLPPAPPNFTQRLYRYLMSAVALVWIARGQVSWSGLAPLYGLLYAGTIAAAYGLFRAALRSRLIAALGSVALTVSAVHLSQLAHIRDYAKAPFILALLLVMAWMALGRLTRGRVLGCAAAFGVVLGIGFGFRQDLLISVPPFLAVVFGCLSGSIRKNLGLKCAAVGVAALAFVMVSWPVLKAYQGGSNTGHVALLGLMTPLDAPLGIEGSVYDWGYTYLDSFAAATVNSYSSRVHGRFVEFVSPEYDRTMVEYILRIARQWPADIVARACASVLKTLDMPFAVGLYTNAVPFGVTSESIKSLYAWQQSVLRVFTDRGPLLMAMALLLVCGQSLFTATALLLLLLYYAGYPAIQFQLRHYFHLEFISWLAIGFLLQRLWDAGAATVRKRRARQPLFNRQALAAAAMRVAVFTVGASGVMTGSLATLRAYQAPRVREMLRGYEGAPLVPLTAVAVPRGEQTLFTLPGLWTARDSLDPVAARYVVAEFSPASCRAAALPVTFRYDTVNDASDFSRTMVLRLSPKAARTRVFFAAYYNGSSSHFSGIEVPRGFETCLASVSSVADLARYALLVGITFPPGWEHATLFQTLADHEVSDPGTGDGRALHTIPRNALVTHTAFDGPLVNPAPVDYAAGIARRAGDGGWVVGGRPQFAVAPLVRYAPHRVAATDRFVVEGELRDGAINIGLTVDDHWVRNLEIRRRGPFLIVITPPGDGEFGVLVTSQLEDRWPANRVGRRLSALVGWIPGVMYHEDVVIRRMGWARE